VLFDLAPHDQLTAVKAWKLLTSSQFYSDRLDNISLKKTAREATDEYAPLVCCARKDSLPRGHGPYRFDCSWSLVRVKARDPHLAAVRPTSASDHSRRGRAASDIAPQLLVNKPIAGWTSY
jgi:hypothetical protein